MRRSTKTQRNKTSRGEAIITNEQPTAAAVMASRNDRDRRRCRKRRSNEEQRNAKALKIGKEGKRRGGTARRQARPPPSRAQTLPRRFMNHEHHAGCITSYLHYQSAHCTDSVVCMNVAESSRYDVHFAHNLSECSRVVASRIRDGKRRAALNLTTEKGQESSEGGRRQKGVERQQPAYACMHG